MGQAIASLVAVVILTLALSAAVWSLSTPEAHLVTTTRCHTIVATHTTTCVRTNTLEP